MRDYWKAIKRNDFPQVGEEFNTIRALASFANAHSALPGVRKKWEVDVRPLLRRIAISHPSTEIDWYICKLLYPLKVVSNLVYGFAQDIAADDLIEKCLQSDSYSWEASMREIYSLLWCAPDDLRNILGWDYVRDTNLSPQLFKVIEPREKRDNQDNLTYYWKLNVILSVLKKRYRVRDRDDGKGLCVAEDGYEGEVAELSIEELLRALAYLGSLKNFEKSWSES